MQLTSACQPTSQHVEHFELLAKKLQKHGADPSEAQLLEAARELLSVCETQKDFLCTFAAATRGEEVLHELAVTSEASPAIYLVSDGAGVVSPPHEHCTWAVIVGLRGNELNTFFHRPSATGVALTPAHSVNVGPGEYLTLHAKDVHSTVTVGDEPTFHVHLYGRPLFTLPPFASRCFAVPTFSPEKQVVDQYRN